MPIFRCYALDGRGRIVAAEDIERSDLAAAIDAGWSFVSSCPPDLDAKGVEIWQGRTMRFSTSPPQQHADHWARAA